MESTAPNYNRAIITVLLGVIAWSTAGLFTRALSLDAATILFWRGLFGAFGVFLLLAVLPQSGGIKSLFSLGCWGMAYALVTAISMLLFVSALKNTSVAHVAVITATVPFIAALLGWLILAQRPSVSAIIASACALAGVIVMVQFANDGQIYGDILAMLMAIGMSFMILISRKNPDMPALPATCLASLISAIAALPFATFASVTANDFTILIAFAIVNQVIGFGLFAIGARWLPPTETALLTALEAPLAPFWVWLVFYEVPASQTMLGGTIVLGAVIAHILWENQKIKTKR